MLKTLDDFRGSFLFQANSFNHVNMKTLSTVLCANEKEILRKRIPEDYALDFYLLNHTLYHLNQKYSRNENLDAKVLDFMNLYINRNADIFHSAFLYLLFIVTKESRHILNDKYDGIGYRFEQELTSNVKSAGKNFGKCLNFVKSMKVKKEESSFGGGRALFDTEAVPNVDIKTYLSFLEYLFKNWDWNDDYGGEVWATITNVLYRFVNGEISPETLVDNMWTLSHNNGLIFNKDVIFRCYSSERQMIEILNAQAIGKLPEYVNNEMPYSYRGRNVFQYIKGHFPELFKETMAYEELIDEIHSYSIY